MAIRFVHAADLHLDTPFEGLSRVSPALRQELVNASLVALDRLTEAAIAQAVDFVVLAGDIYDGAVRGVRAQLRLLAATRRLEAAGIPVFMVHGNHDPVDEGWSAIRHWPKSVHIFPVDRVETHDLVARDGSRVAISGISYGQRDVRESLHARFPRPPANSDVFHLAVLHCNVGGVGEHASYSPARLEDLAASGHDYWALGHIHRRAILRPFAPAIVYPGNLQGRGFKATELGAKGAVLVEAGAGSVQVTFLELAPVRFEQIDFDASGCDDVGQVVEGLLDAARDLQTGGRVVVRARVTGPSPACESLRRLDALDEIARSLDDAGRLLPEIAWADLRIETRPAVDLDSLVGRGDLLGQLADEAGLLSADDVGAMIRGEEGLRGLPELDPAELRAAIRRAAEFAVVLLGEDA